MLTKQVWAVVGSHGKNPVAEQLSEVSTAMRVRRPALAGSHPGVVPQKLLRAGKTVYRVNPKNQPPAEFSTIAEIGQPVDCVNLVINAALGAAIVEECAARPDPNAAA